MSRTPADAVSDSVCDRPARVIPGRHRSFRVHVRPFGRAPLTIRPPATRALPPSGPHPARVMQRQWRSARLAEVARTRPRATSTVQMQTEPPLTDSVTAPGAIVDG